MNFQLVRSDFLRPACILLALSFANAIAGAADSITPSPNLPATSPWNLERLSQVPSFKWEDEAAPVRSILYEGEPYGGKPTRVFAYYATPQTLAGTPAAKPHSLPGIVLVHGGGGTAFREWAEIWAKRGYAAIAMDLTGHRPTEGKDANQKENRTALPDGAPAMDDPAMFADVEKAPGEQWSYHAVADAIRAHSLLRSFPEVDPDRTALTGISWGGYLTCITAGVDSRFKAAVPVYGCGFLGDNSAWLDRLNKMTPAQRERWITLWDPSRYLPAVTMPILFVNGTNDFAYPLDSYMKSYAAVPGTKQMCVTVNMPHSHQAGWAPKEIGIYIDSILLGGKPLPKLGTPETKDGKVRALCASPLKIARAGLHFTTGTGPINKRDWVTKDAEIGEGVIRADAPPADATAWFMTATDERDATASTTVWLRKSGD